MDIRYRRYFDAMPCYVTVQDRNFRIIDANQRFQADFGDYRGRLCHQIYRNRSECCEICPVERSFRDGFPHSSQGKVRCLDGREVSVVVYTTPIRDESGEITSVMEMSTDITDISRLQNQLRGSQERYHLLFEEVPCYISIQDRDLKLVDTNRAFREDFGGFLGCNCFEIYKHRTQECIPCPVRETFQDGEVHSSEEIVTSRDGKQLNVIVYTNPIRDSAGNIRYVMEMSTNITPIRELQSKLESTGMLISSISHNIKGLLTGLDGGMYLVNTAIEKDNPVRLKRGWAMVQRNVDRIRDMVLNILYYAKEREPIWEQISALELAQEVCELVSDKAKEHRVKIIRELDASAQDFECDRKALRALLINLAENSLDACRVDQKKGSHQVTIGAKGYSEYIEFEIVDNGIGMDRETREKAFTPFFSSKGSDGTGLGLFIADKIIRAHNGTLELSSQLDIGTRFVVRMPRRRDQTTATPTGC